MFVTYDLGLAQQLAKYLDTHTITRQSVQLDELNNLNRPEVKTDTNIPYYDLIDSRIDADLIVTKFLIKNLIQVSPDNRRAVGQTLEMEISLHESYSGWFVKLLQDVNLKSTIEPVFIIKPFFVGIKDIGSEPEILKLNYHYIMIMTELQADYTPAGSNYVVKGLCDINGLGNSPTTHSPILNQLSVKFPPNSTLTDAIEKTFCDEINKVALARTVPDTSTVKFTRTQYKFVVDDLYKSSAEYNIDSAAPISTATGKNDITLSFNGCSVYEAILKILIYSNKILEDAQISLDVHTIEGVQYYTKYRPYITSKTSYLDSVLTITYTIHKRKFVSSKDPYIGLSDSKEYESVKAFERYINQNADGSDFSKNDIIVYDYVFTGKNVDVLDYKLSLIQSIVAVQASENANLFNNHNLDTFNKTTINTENLICKSQPQCATVSTGSVSKQIDPIKVTKFYDVLNKATFFESVSNVMTVVGNTTLLGRVTLKQGDNGEELLSANSMPYIIYINVKYPVSSNFWSYDTNNTTQPLLAPFWYQGPQQIIQFDTVFEGNTFFHIISTLPLLKETNAADTAIEANKPSVTSQPIKKGSKSAETNIAKVGTYITLLGRSVAQPPNTKIEIAAPYAPIKFKPGTPLTKHVITGNYYSPRVRKYEQPDGSVRKVNGIHFGTDLRARVGTAVFSPVDGKITTYPTIEYADNKPGWRIDITTVSGVTIRFYHVVPVEKFKEASKRLDIVAGEQFCTTANISQPHLHIEIHYKGKVFNCVPLLEGVTYDIK